MAEDAHQRRLAAILAADIVGFSRLMGLDESGTLTALKALRAEVTDPKIAEHKGRIFKTTGDGLLVEFPSVVNAVACALDIQRAMELKNAHIPADRILQFRIGVNLGDVIIEGDDVFGDGVNVAARLEGMAPPGGIVVSAMVRDNIGTRLTAAFEDMGELQLKNIQLPIRSFLVRSGSGVREQNGANTSAEGTPSIAVLPFNNMSGDPEQEYFADGITEDIITELARNRGLFVIARNSSFTFKGAAVNISEVGRKLGVRYVVEGSVRKAGKRVRVTAQLIEVASGNHIWAERYDRDLEDIFAVQDEITRNIVVAIPDHLESHLVRATRQKPTESLTAYDHYLRGLEIVNRWQNDEIPEAMTEFTAAAHLDPNFARARAMLGYVHLRVNWQTDDPHSLDEANRETEVAVRLDLTDSACLQDRALVLLTLRDFDLAFDVLQRALRLSPYDVSLASTMAWYETCIGQHANAIKRLQNSTLASPVHVSQSHHQIMGIALMMSQQYEEAVKSFAAIQRPEYYIPVFASGCLMKIGRIQEARPYSQLASELRSDWATQDLSRDFMIEQDRQRVHELLHLAIAALGDGA